MNFNHCTEKTGEVYSKGEKVTYQYLNEPAVSSVAHLSIQVCSPVTVFKNTVHIYIFNRSLA